MKRKTKTAAFLARVEKLIRRKGPAFERVKLAIRDGLLTPGQGSRKERGGALAGALHCMDLVRIHTGRGVVDAIETTREPESVLVYLAFAAEHIERVMDAVNAEFDRAEADAARRSA